MPTRTIELTEATTATPAAGNRVIVRSERGIEVIKPPTGAVRLMRGHHRATLSFGRPDGGTTLVITGRESHLTHLFDAITGVTP